MEDPTAALAPASLRVRRALQTDCHQYFVWASDELVRSSSLVTGPLDFERHRDWFQDRLSEPFSYLYLVECGSIPIGQVRFAVSQSIALLSYSVDSAHRGKGLAKHLLALALRKLSLDCPSCRLITAQVKPDNAASLRVLVSCGFREKAAAENSEGILLLEKVLP